MKKSIAALCVLCLIAFAAGQTGPHRKIFASGGGGCGNPPHPAYVTSAQFAESFAGGSTYDTTKTITYSGGVGHALVLAEITSFSSSSIFITGITDDGGNSWTHINTLSGWMCNGQGCPDTWMASAISPTTQIVITFHVIGVAFGSATASGGVIVGEYSGFTRSAVNTTFTSSPQQQLSVTTAPTTIIGVFLNGNQVALNSFSGPYNGGQVRQIVNVSGPYGGGLNYFANIALTDGLTGPGTISEGITNPQPPTNTNFMVGEILGPNCS